MKKHHQLLSLVAMLALLMAGDVFSAWTVPGQLPPNGNVDAPINVGTTDQIKVGGLGIGGLDVAGGAIVRGTSVTTDVDFTVMGKVGAREYCDESGVNCWEPATGGTPGTVDYVSYAKSHCGLEVINPSRLSLNGVKLKNGSFYDFFDGVNAHSVLEWGCEGPDQSANFAIENACGLRVSNPGSVSLHAVQLSNGTNYDLYDENGSSAILRWQCGATMSEVQNNCGFSIANPGSVSVHEVKTKTGVNFDIYDENDSTATLEWTCR